MLNDELGRFDPAVPADYVPTSKAIRELVLSDARYRELMRTEETSTSAEEQAGAKQAAAERLAELELCFFSAIDQGEIEVVVLDVRNNWRPVVVPGSYWHESMVGNDSIWAGQLVILGRFPPGVPSRMADSPVCFRRSDWSSWLAARDVQRAPAFAANDERQATTDQSPAPAASATSSVPKTEDVARLTKEILARRDQGDIHDRDAMRLWTKREIRHMTSDEADALYYQVPVGIRKSRKQGRPSTRKSGRA